MTERADVVIVGARCAGAPLATDLARRGLHVCLLDRATFPGDTLSTHGIQPCGVQALGRLGVLDQVRAVTTPIERAVVALDDARMTFDDVPGLLGAPMLNVRRLVLDEILVAHAAASGADVRTGVAVTGLLTEGGRVTGVRTARGDIEATVVIGADGANSTVARLVGAAEYLTTQPGRVFVWAYLSGVAFASPAEQATVWLGKSACSGFLASATDSGLFMAAVTVDEPRRREVVRDREAFHRGAFATWPELEDLVRSGRIEGPVRVMGRWHGFFRRSAGPGWALVGDAGHVKDPSPGQGIADALRQAERLASAVCDGFGGATSLDEALAAWWRWRDRDARDMYWFAQDLGAPGPTLPLMRAVQRRIAQDPRLTERLALVLNHDLPPSALTPARVVLGGLADALRSNPGGRAAVLREARSLVAAEARRAAAAPRVSRWAARTAGPSRSG
jgi:2-polyprenyl-6-methoxyphenol hydroxylase-like FAD-dependent oxidoreductase